MYTLEEHIQQRDRINRGAVRMAQAQRGVNEGMKAAVIACLEGLAEQQRWLDAGLLAMFRNWRNR